MMSHEGKNGYSRQAYEDAEKEIEEIAHSVNADTSPHEIREKFTEQSALVEEKELLHNEAWDQAKAEDAARLEHEEAAGLLKKMHEAAGIKPEAVMEKPSGTRAPAERDDAQSDFDRLSNVIAGLSGAEEINRVMARLEASPKYDMAQKEVLAQLLERRSRELRRVEGNHQSAVEKEAVLSPEQLKQKETQEGMEKLFESLDLSRGGKENGPQDVISGSLLKKIEFGLADEKWNDGEKRKKLFLGSVGTATVGFIGGLGGMLAAGGEGAGVLLGYTGASIGLAGLSFAGAALAAGGIGWLGMKAFHALKERKHKKTFDKLIRSV